MTREVKRTMDALEPRSTHPEPAGSLILKIQGVIMTSNITEFINKHLACDIDVTFTQYFDWFGVCGGHIFGGVATVSPRNFVVHNDSTGHWGSFITYRWESWDDDDGRCTRCDREVLNFPVRPSRLMFDIVDDDHWPIMMASTDGASFTAWNTNGMLRGQTEKVKVELLDARNLPLR